MPAEAIHLTALREAVASPRLDTPARKRILRREDAARLGAILVDMPYFDRFPEEVVRYLLVLPARPSPWGNRLHEEGPIALLLDLVRRAREMRDETLGALALGLASHASIDRQLHPLINALATERSKSRKADHGTLHREVEKFQSVCFHEAYLGRDFMGTPLIKRYIENAFSLEIADRRTGRALVESIGTAFGDAPTLAEWRRWAKGYRSYGVILGSLAGKTLCTERDKEWGRPMFLAGKWGSFDDLLAKAIERSVDVVNATEGAIQSEAGEARLRELMPPGTIDGMGEDVDLAIPYVSRT